MKAIEIVSIPVTNQQKSKEFYLKIGFQLMVEAPVGPGLNWVQLGLEDQTTSFSISSVCIIRPCKEPGAILAK